MQPPWGHLKSDTSADFAEWKMFVCDETIDTFDQTVEADTLNVFLIMLLALACESVVGVSVRGACISKKELGW